MQTALADVASWLEHCPVHQKGAGSVPDQGSYPGFAGFAGLILGWSKCSMFLSPLPQHRRLIN